MRLRPLHSVIVGWWLLALSFPLAAGEQSVTFWHAAGVGAGSG
jgi:hypothetical protein